MNDEVTHDKSALAFNLPKALNVLLYNILYVFVSFESKKSRGGLYLSQTWTKKH